MKEKIYTIPLTEAIKEDCECLLCFIEDKISKDATGYFIGAAMMEVSVRTVTNEKGFCAHHYNKMYESENKLSLALLLQSRLRCILDGLEPDGTKKKSLFKKNRGQYELGKFSSCAVCEKVSGRMDACISNFIYLLEAEPEFKQLFMQSKGLCMKHFEKVAPHIGEALFIEIAAVQAREMKRIAEEIDRFTQKFDYRNANMDWNGAQDAPLRASQKLRGSY